MVITCYKTGLDPQHRRVSADTSAYLSHLTPYPRTIAGDILAGAPLLSVELETNGDGQYNYCAIEDAQRNTFYYFMSPVRNSPKSTFYALSLDWWAYVSTARTPLLASGILRRSHLMHKHTQTFAPVTQMDGGGIMRVRELKETGFNRVSVVVSATLKENRSILYFSPPVSPVNERTVLQAYIDNYTNPKKINDIEITSVNNAWLIPWDFVSTTATPNATLVLDADPITTTPTQQIDVYWFSATYTAEYTQRFPQTLQPVFVGNFGEKILLPFTGSKVNEISLQYRHGATTGCVGVILHVNDTAVDMTNSLTLEFSTNRATEREETRRVSNAVSVAGSALSLASGIASHNPVAISYGAVSLGGVLGGIATSQPTAHVVRAGVGMLNITRNIAGEYFYVSPCGFMGYYVRNWDEVSGELSRYGYTGAAHVEHFDLAQSGGRVDGAYFQFTDPVIDRANAGMSIPDEAAAALTDMCVNGYTCYFDTLETLAFGQPLALPPTSFDIDGNPVE